MKRLGLIQYAWKIALFIGWFIVFPLSAQENDLCGKAITADTILDRDLTCSGEGVIIRANYITLDCNGHTITGTGIGNGISLYESTGVTVRNCNVTNFNNGFYIGGSIVSGSNAFENNTANGNTQNGFYLVLSYYNTFSQNTAKRNNIGFSLVNTPANILRQNTACKNNVNASQDSSSTNNVFVENKFCCPTSGIQKP